MSENWDEIGRELGTLLRALGVQRLGADLPVRDVDYEDLVTSGCIITSKMGPDLSTPQRRAVWAGWLTLQVQEMRTDPLLYVEPNEGGEIWQVMYSNGPGRWAGGESGPSVIQALMAALAKAAA